MTIGENVANFIYANANEVEINFTEKSETMA